MVVPMAPGGPKKTNQEIDRNLKRAFDEVAAEPLPDRFAKLIARLKAEKGAAPEKDD